jgi:hypothetical protein
VLLKGRADVIGQMARFEKCCEEWRGRGHWVPFFGFWVLGIILNFPEPSQISQNPKKPVCLRKRRTQRDVHRRDPQYTVINYIIQNITTRSAKRSERVLSIVCFHLHLHWLDLSLSVHAHYNRHPILTWQWFWRSICNVFNRLRWLTMAQNNRSDDRLIKLMDSVGSLQFTHVELVRRTHIE